MPEDGSLRPFQKLPRSFRLKRKRLIRPLFDRSREDVGTIGKGCIRLVYRIVPRAQIEAGAPVQIGFAPGRHAKAASRNRIKRLLRETYRLHQQGILDRFAGTESVLTMMIVHRAGRQDDTRPSRRVYADLPEALQELCRRLDESSMRSERRT